MADMSSFHFFISCMSGLLYSGFAFKSEREGCQNPNGLIAVHAPQLC